MRRSKPADAESQMTGVKTAFPKPGNMLYPLPAVMVTCQEEDGKQTSDGSFQHQKSPLRKEIQFLMP